MRVAIDARPMARDITGVGRYVLKLVEGLRDRGILVSALYNTKPAYRVPGISSVVLPSASRFWWEQSVLPKYLYSETFDIFHATWNYGIPFLYRGTTVLTVLDVIPLKWPRYFLGKKLFSLPEYLFSLYGSLVKADRVISISKTSTNDIISVYPFAKKKITTILLAMDVPVLSTKTTVTFARPYIVYLGGVDKRKNIDGLLRAYARSKSKHTHDLLFIGRNANHFLPLAHELAVEKRVHFPGFVEELDKFILLKDATCLVYPSFYEGFGVPILEAMSVGTPVITSNTSSLLEIAGDAALLVDPKDINTLAHSIDLLVQSDKMRDEFREKGFQRMREFSWDTMVDTTVEVYKNVLS